MTSIHLATGDGPIVVTRHGERWRAARPLDVRSASCIAADPCQPERIFCTTAGDGVWRSDDAGETWRQVLDGAACDRMTCVAVSAAEPAGGTGVVYVGTEPSAVWRSDDGGETWHDCEGLMDLPSSSDWHFPPRPETHHVRWIALDPLAPENLFAAIEAGALIRSPDGGKTWRDRVPGGPYDTHQLVMHPNVPGRLWSAAGDGFYESDDAGETWRRSERGLAHRYCWSLAIDPDRPGSAVLSAAAGPRHAHDAHQAEAHLYRRTADDEPWQEVRAGLADPKGTRTYALASDPGRAGVFYAGSAGGLYRSTDAGASWAPLPVDWPSGYTGSRIHVMATARTG